MSKHTANFYRHLLHLYEELLTLKEDGQIEFLYQNPVLFSKHNCYFVHQQIEEGYFSLIPRFQDYNLEELLDPLKRIAGMCRYFLIKPQEFPLGRGPVERIWNQFGSNKISLEYAQQLIADESLYISAESYLYSLCCHCEILAQTGNWRTALAYLKILQSGIEHRSYYPWNHRDQEHVVLTLLEVVTRATHDIPNAKHFNEAINRALQFVGVMKEGESFYYPGELDHRLAVIHYDPFFAGKNLNDYDTAFQSWQMKLRNEFGNSIFMWDEKDRQLPHPRVTLPKAIEFGQKAAEMRSGELKARSLKVVADAMFAGKHIGVVIDESKLLEIAKKALSIYKEIPGEQYAINALTHIIDVMNGTDISSHKMYYEQLEELLHMDLVNIPSSTSTWLLIERVFNLANNLKAEEPKKCLDLLLHYEPLLYTSADHQHINSFLNTMALCVFHLYVPTTFDWDTDSFDDLHANIRREAERNNWNKDEITATELKLCAICSSLNQEIKGIALAERIVDTNSEFISRYHSVFSHIQFQLYLGEAVNSFEATDYTTSIEYYTKALKVLLDENRIVGAKELIYRMEDIILNVDGYDVAKVAVFLGVYTLNIQIKLGLEITGVLHNLFKRLLSRHIDLGDYNSELIIFLLQQKKGLRFASVMHSSAKVSWSQNRRLLQFDEELQKLKTEQHQENTRTRQEYKVPVLDDHMLMASVYGEPMILKGDSVEDRIINLQQVFDAEFQRFIMQYCVDEHKFVPKFYSEIQSKIPEKTALIDYSFGQSHSGVAQVYITIITKEDQFFTVCNLSNIPSGHVSLAHDGKKINVNLITFLVSEVRRGIIEEPGFKNVGSGASELLGIDYKIYFGGQTPKILAELRSKGIEHLCIVPCDTLFFYPIHLLGEEDNPIANDWKISYLPTIQHLTNETLPKIVSNEMAVFAVRETKSAPSYLKPLEHVEMEAQAIAEIFKVKPILGDIATEFGFYYALSESKYVHLAAHGEHNEYAPCYHSIYLQPSLHDDGVVHAFEIYGKDFSGVELLTLSACETALGRVDVASNLYGLPAAFLHAGVKTIIGTLWEVETQTSAFFFTTFYRMLKQVGKKLDAFYAAQQETRSSFPQYRDWGAFYYMGQF